MHRNFLTLAAFFGASGVALGAFGAHGLQQLTADEKILHSYQTAVQYQLYHALALLAVGILYEKMNRKWIRVAGYLLITGTLLFSGSLYLITILKLNGSDAFRFVGPVTPLGGVFFITGWICLMVGVLRK
jgi:uncharacterized membrane protein YgdD (TMEM256/DUF423 family)